MIFVFAQYAYDFIRDDIDDCYGNIFSIYKLKSANRILAPQVDNGECAEALSNWQKTHL